MSSLATVARPYAKAIAELAQADDGWARWQTVLEALAGLAEDAQAQVALSDPRLSKEDILDVLASAFGKKLDKAGIRLLRLLVENKRLAVGREMLEQFEALQDEALGQVHVYVDSAVKLTAAQKKNLVQMMEKRLSRKVSLNCHVDESLHAGVVIRHGDEVINASVRGRLQRLASQLRAVV